MFRETGHRQQKKERSRPPLCADNVHYVKLMLIDRLPSTSGCLSCYPFSPKLALVSLNLAQYGWVSH
jgi:hypothetical protein